MGRGLFSWLYDYFARGVGVLGYDPILGALSPPLRLLMHVAFTILLWSILVFLVSLVVPGSSTADDRNRPFVSTCGWVALAVHVGAAYVCHYRLPGVSVPGGPRPHKIRRRATWTPGGHPLPKEAAAAAAYRQAAASHEATNARFAGTAAFLTGEPVGRDIWTMRGDGVKPRKRVDEKLVQELAKGGSQRQFGSFDPSVNPNSSDQIFRAQCIREYLATPGNKAPDNKNKPENIEQVLRRGVHFYSMLQTEDGHFSG